jgi:(+)-trans-carveol dehydrogenase
MGRFDGKVAFVTGAARGQGANHAVRFAEEGADVIAIDIAAPVKSVPYEMPTQEDLDAVRRRIEACGRRAFVRQADVRDHDQIRAVVDEGAAELGGLDVVVANAGIGSIVSIEEMEVDVWQETIDINLTGVWITVKASIPHLRSRGAGSIVLTSSVFGLGAMPNLAHYNASKHGVLGIMKTVALELGPELIRCNAVLPTNVDTPMIQNEFVRRLYLPDLESPTRADGEAEGSPYILANAIPVPWVDSDDITNAVLFLASDQARYITGAALPVDAGFLLKR